MSSTREISRAGLEGAGRKSYGRSTADPLRFHYTKNHDEKSAMLQAPRSGYADPGLSESNLMSI